MENEKTPKNSCSEDASLARLMLAKLGRIKGDEPDEVVLAAYAEHAKAKAAESVAAGQQRDSLEAIERRAMTARLKAHGIDAGGMSLSEMRQRVGSLGRERQQERTLGEQIDALAVKQRRNSEMLFDQSGCPVLHRLNLDKMDSGKSDRWAKVRDALASQAIESVSGYMVALLGHRGTGKTQLAVSLIHQCCQYGMTCRYVKALDMFRDIRRSYAPTAKGEAGVSEIDVAEEWTRPSMLVIDECHQRGETQWENNSLTNLLDRRYDACVCTVLIANLTREEFSDALGSSVVSRIHETGATVICDWPSFRRKGMWPGAASLEGGLS